MDYLNCDILSALKDWKPTKLRRRVKSVTEQCSVYLNDVSSGSIKSEAAPQRKGRCKLEDAEQHSPARAHCHTQAGQEEQGWWQCQVLATFWQMLGDESGLRGAQPINKRISERCQSLARLSYKQLRQECSAWATGRELEWRDALEGCSWQLQPGGGQCCAFKPINTDCRQTETLIS